jgi:CelD/BcsL family acetyltransferase involved in cellulose biosynthesis
MILEQREDPWRVVLSSIDSVESLERKWTALERRSTCSFFQSWGWIGTWLACLPASRRPQVLEVLFDGTVVGLALLGKSEIRRHGFISSNALFVTETGDSDFDCLTVEHNGFLVDDSISTEVLRQGISWLAGGPFAWDELFVSAVTKRNVAAYVNNAEEARLHAQIALSKPYYYVDCDKIRSTGGDYIATLSRNTRSQVRRAMRAYEERGAIRFHAADSFEMAQEYFQQLRELHQQRWESRAEPGAFGSAFALQFHEGLLRNRFSAGEIQLAAISAGDDAIGYLYNFVFDGVVYNYQSGFRYTSDARLKPGLVSHCCAIQHCIDSGVQLYDFLMGSQRFKQSLASDQDEMSWLVLQRPRLRFRVERTARKWRDKMRSLQSSASLSQNGQTARSAEAPDHHD